MTIKADFLNSFVTVDIYLFFHILIPLLLWITKETLANVHYHDHAGLTGLWSMWFSAVFRGKSLQLGLVWLFFGSFHANEVSKCALSNSTSNTYIHT